MHRTLEEFVAAREFLEDAYKPHKDLESNWVGGVALFELAVLDLKEAEAKESAGVASSSEKHGEGEGVTSSTKLHWPTTFSNALEKLEKAMAISGSNVDLSSRLDSRVNMLKNEIALKKEMLGLS